MIHFIFSNTNVIIAMVKDLPQSMVASIPSTHPLKLDI